MLRAIHKGIILETSVEREKDVQHIDAHGEFEKLMVTYRDVGNAENAGAVFGHLIGDESFFKFSRCVKRLCILS